MGRKSSSKGSTFERKVAGLVLQAANAGAKRAKCERFTNKDCFRTPKSGGHPFIEGKSDLQIKKKLRLVFPFCVECKHRKTWKLEQMFTPTKDFRSFCRQVVRDSSRDSHKRHPLLVISGNRSGVFAAAPLGVLSIYLCGVRCPHFVFRYRKEFWAMVRFSTVLKHLTRYVATGAKLGTRSSVKP